MYSANQARVLITAFCSQEQFLWCYNFCMVVRVGVRGALMKRPAPMQSFDQFTLMQAMFEELQRMAKEYAQGSSAVAKALELFESVKRGAPGLPGNPGAPGKTPVLDYERLAQAAAKYIRTPEDGADADEAAMEDRIFSRLSKLMRKGKKGEKGDAVTADKELVLSTFFSLLESGELKLKTEHIQGLEPRFGEIRNQIANRAPVYGQDTWARGGGDTVVAGGGISIQNTGNGNKRITATAVGNTVWGEEVAFTGTSGTLAHTPTAGTLRLYRGGVRIQEGAGKDYTLSGAAITLASAASVGEIFLADYSY